MSNYYTVIRNNAVFGQRRSLVRDYEVGAVKPYAQHEKAVSFGTVEPRERRWYYEWIVPDDLFFVQVERDGVMLYDSRRDIPVDEASFSATQERFRKKPAS